MGGRESTEALQVKFNHSNLSYFAGEKITGNVSFLNRHGKLILEEIFLDFIGEIGNSRSEAQCFLENLDNSQPDRRADHHRIPFMNVRLPLVQPENGKREIILRRGSYSWPFEFTLPKRLPPSMIPIKVPYPYVKYYARIVLDKPWYKSNAQHTYPLSIFPHVNLFHIPNAQRIVPFSYLNRKDIQLDGYLSQGGTIPGENLMIYINIKNPKQCCIKRMEAVLMRHLQVAQTHHKDIVARGDLSEIHNFNGRHFEQILDLITPMLQLAPSYKYMARFNRQTLPVIAKYELNIEVKTQGVLTDFEVKIPLIIGTKRELDQQQTEASMSNYEESPPAYETLVFNEMI